MDVRGQAARDEGAGRGAIGELRVDPEVGEHLQQMRLAAPEEAADPGGFLPPPAEVGDEPFEDAAKAVGEPPVADEGLQFGAELGVLRGVGRFADPRLALVGERGGPRVAFEKFVDLRIRRHGQPSSWSVMACAR